MRILIADDHALFQKGLSLLLKQLYPDAEVTAAPDADRALERLPAEPPFDLILIDLSMPGMSGVADVTRFVEQAGDAPVVILSAYCDAQTVIRAIDCGASGYILKAASDEVFKNAVSLVLSGETYVPSVVIASVNRSAGPLPDSMKHLEAENPLRSLTQRQRDTLALVMDGLSNKEIARNLGLLESTVKAHVKVILQKLKAANRTQAAMIATDLGLPREPRSDS
jgi:DNA-binding NarL/FixJ family response regulator